MEHKVTVIVPVYKVEAYLHRCIDSIINQTYKNLEIILVDDGSPDRCGEICEEYATKDERIIVIHQKNQGLSCARNTGLDIASGEYIAYVDSDDYLDTTMFDKMMKFILKHDLEIMEIEPKNSTKNIVFDDSFILENPIDATKRILKNTSFSVWRRIFKRSLVNDLRFIPGLIHQDVFYLVDILKRIKMNGYLSSPLYFYNTENISIQRSAYSIKKINTAVRATNYIKDNILESESLKKTLENYILYHYTDHFFQLSRNTNLDPQKKYRKMIKKDIFNSLNTENLNLRTLLILILPTKLVEIISSFYIKISTRLQITN